MSESTRRTEAHLTVLRAMRAEGSMMGVPTELEALDAAIAAPPASGAVPEGYVQISKTALRGMIGDEAMAQIEATCVYPVAAAKKEAERKG